MRGLVVASLLSLPDTNVVTMADRLIMLTGLIVAAVGVTIAPLMLFARDRITAHERLDRFCRWIFPSFYPAMLVLIVA